MRIRQRQLFHELAGPVVLKVSSPDVAHKSEIGGVVVGITNEAAVRREFDGLVARTRERAPEAQVEGVLVAPMISGHVEAIVGTQLDPTFGPVVMVGLGGIHAEIFATRGWRLRRSRARRRLRC